MVNGKYTTLKNNLALKIPVHSIYSNGPSTIIVNGYYGFPIQACCGGTKAKYGEQCVDKK